MVQAVTEARVDRAAGAAIAPGLRRAAALVALSLVLFLPGFFALPPVDRDEARFAQATKQMVETGDYADIRFQDEPRYKKPIGIYWLQAAAAHLSGEGAAAPIWVYRLPSLVGAVGAVVALAWAGAPLVGPTAAGLAALLLASSILIGVEARLAKTDAMLLLAVVLAQGALIRAWLGRFRMGWHIAALFWTALAAGILLKGPVILLVVGATAAALSIAERRVDWLVTLRPGLGVPYALVLVLPWFLAIGLKSGGGFFQEAVGRDLLGKMAEGQEAHWAPPGTYLAAIWGTFWPWAPIAALAVPWIWRNRRAPVALFCLAWLVPTWFIFELIPTKLPHYVLPLYPALALMIAAVVENEGLGLERRSAQFGLALIPAFGAGIAIAALGVLYASEGEISIVGATVCAAAVALLVFGTRTFLTGESRRAIVSVTAGAGLLYLACYQIILPALDRLWPSPRISAAVARVADTLGCTDAPVAATGFREPSMVFLLGTTVRLTGGRGAAEFLAQGGCRVAVVEQRREAEFMGRLAELKQEPALGERVTGININGGRSLDIGIYGLKTGP